METGLFERIVNLLGAIVWGPHTLLLLIGVGIFLTVRLRFIQIRRLGLSFRLLIRGRDDEDLTGDISPLQALTTSLAATIGNGNIAGVCTAIALGGPGTVFWMWLAAFFGMATKIVEAVLGQRFRIIAPDGSVAGGPMYYISRGLGLGWLAAIFAFFMGGKALFATTIVQSNSIALALKTQVGIAPWISGLGLALLVWLVIIGGIKWIARVTVVLSPFMVVLYLGGA
ncbi:alanine/glycine:cation symporter family protein, partial [Gemmatimonadota bacterium]